MVATTQKQASVVDAVSKAMVMGRGDATLADAQLSTGFYAVLAALRLCRSVSVFGFGIDQGTHSAAHGTFLSHLRGLNVSSLRAECNGGLYTRYYHAPEQYANNSRHKKYLCHTEVDHPFELEHLALELLHYLGVLTAF